MLLRESPLAVFNRTDSVFTGLKTSRLGAKIAWTGRYGARNCFSYTRFGSRRCHFPFAFGILPKNARAFSSVARLITSLGVDLMFIAECRMESTKLLSDLTKVAAYHRPFKICHCGSFVFREYP